MTLVERADVPLEHVLGREVGEIYAEIHRDHGVELLHRGGSSSASRATAASSAVRLADGARDRLRLRRRRRRRRAAHRARRARRARGRQRHRRRRAARDERRRRLRRRRRRQRLPPLLRAPAPRRALGQRAPPARDRRAGDARQAGELRPAAVLLLRPVRGRDGVLGLRRPSGTRSSSAATSTAREFIAFWLARRPRRRRHERNVWDVTDPIQELIRPGRPVAVEQLRDPEVPLEDLADHRPGSGAARGAAGRMKRRRSA